MGFRDREINLTTPAREFRVSTSRVDGTGISRMGPDVRINAHNSADAKQRVEKAGHTVNSHFEPTETTQRK